LNQQVKLNFKNTGLRIYREEGIRGLFMGIKANYLKTIPSIIASFSIYEICLNHYNKYF